MTASGAFHLFQCTNADNMNELLKVDLIGIGVMIAGSAVSPLYYTYMCEDSMVIGKFWLGQIWLFCTLASVLTIQIEELRSSSLCPSLGMHCLVYYACCSPCNLVYERRTGDGIQALAMGRRLCSLRSRSILLRNEAT